MKQDGLSNAPVWGVVVSGSTTGVFRTALLVMFDGEDSIMVVSVGADWESTNGVKCWTSLENSVVLFSCWGCEVGEWIVYLVALWVFELVTL